MSSSPIHPSRIGRIEFIFDYDYFIWFETLWKQVKFSRFSFLSMITTSGILCWNSVSSPPSKHFSMSQTSLPAGSYVDSAIEKLTQWGLGSRREEASILQWQMAMECGQWLYSDLLESSTAMLQASKLIQCQFSGVPGLLISCRSRSPDFHFLNLPSDWLCNPLHTSTVVSNFLAYALGYNIWYQSLIQVQNLIVENLRLVIWLG